MIYGKLAKKIILVLIFSLISCIIFTNATYAQSLDEMISSADDFLKTGADDAIDTAALKTTSDYIYNTLLVIAVAVAVIVGTYLGIKFMLESAEDKAKIKEAMIPFIVGCFVIFGAFGIWKIAVNVGNGISGDVSSNSWDTVDKTQAYANYAQWKEKNNISNDYTAASRLVNLNVSTLTKNEKENYKTIIKEAITTLASYRGDTSAYREQLKDKLEELNK